MTEPWLGMHHFVSERQQATRNDKWIGHASWLDLSTAPVHQTKKTARMFPRLPSMTHLIAPSQWNHNWNNIGKSTNQRKVMNKPKFFFLNRSTNSGHLHPLSLSPCYFNPVKQIQCFTWNQSDLARQATMKTKWSWKPILACVLGVRLMWPIPWYCVINPKYNVSRETSWHSAEQKQFPKTWKTNP